MLEIEPDSEKHWNSKGVLLAKLDRVKEAISAFDRSLEIDSEVPKTWYSKGVVLMDKGMVRAALGCFYKTLDLDPIFEKAKERFLKCLDEMALQKQANATEEQDTEEKWISGPGEPSEEKETNEIEEETAPPPPRRKRKKGSYLDEDMFLEEDDEEEEEEWEEFEEEEMEEDWEDFDEEEDDEEEHPFITCRCGNRIPITSEERPYRFVCDECGRSGTLK